MSICVGPVTTYLMTEQQFIMHKEAKQDQQKAVETILRLGVRKPQRENARNK
jgi:hypothetical protein